MRIDSPRTCSSRRPLEDQHVGVDRHADRQHDAGDAGQRERRVEQGHDAQDDQHVQHHRDERDDAGQVVVADQEHRDDHEAEDAGEEPAAEVVGAELGADGALGDRLVGELRLERAGVERADEVVELGLLEPALPALNDAAVGDAGAEVGGGDDLLVEDDGERLADVVARQVAEELPADGVEVEGDHRLAVLAERAVGTLEAPLGRALAVVHRPVFGDPGERVGLAVVLADRAVDLAALLLADLEPLERVAGAHARALGGEARLHRLDLGGLGVDGEDVELEHAGPAQLALQVGDVVDLVADLDEGLERGDVGVERRLAGGELGRPLLDRGELLLAVGAAAQLEHALELVGAEVGRVDLRLGGEVGLPRVGGGLGVLVLARLLELVPGAGHLGEHRLPRRAAPRELRQPLVAVGRAGRALDGGDHLAHRDVRRLQRLARPAQVPPEPLGGDALRRRGHLDLQPRVAVRAPHEVADALGVDALLQRAHDLLGQPALVRRRVGRPVALGRLDLVQQARAALHVDAGLEVDLLPPRQVAVEELGRLREQRPQRRQHHDRDGQDSTGIIRWHDGEY
jgi:hypothetical protein